jgi:hypothetical protein
MAQFAALSAFPGQGVQPLPANSAGTPQSATLPDNRGYLDYIRSIVDAPAYTGDTSGDMGVQTNPKPTFEPNPNTNAQAELAKWNARDTSIDPYWAQRFSGYNDYFREGQFEPGSKDATLDVAIQAERQWAHDNEPGVWDKLMSAAPIILLSASGFGTALAGMMAPTLGATGAAIASGAVIGGGAAALSGGDVLKGAVTGGIGGGFGQFASGFDKTGLISDANLVNAGGAAVRGLISGTNPLTAAATSLVGSATANATGSPGAGTAAALGAGLIANNGDVAKTINTMPINTATPTVNPIKPNVVPANGFAQFNYLDLYRKGG